MTYPQDIASNTPAPYRFKLLNPDTSEEVILTTEPIGWKGGTLEIDREILIGGVFSKFSSGTLTFIKEGAKFLRDIWDSKEINGRCNLHIYWFKFSTQTYVEFPSSFALNFSTIKTRVKVGRFTIGVAIEAVNNDTLTKFRNRKSTVVDITKRNSLGGYPIVDYGEGIMQPLPKNINIPAVNKANSAAWGGYGYRSSLLGLSHSKSYTTPKADLEYSDFTGLVSIPYKTKVLNINDLTPLLRYIQEPMDLELYAFCKVNVIGRYWYDHWTAKFISTDNLNNILDEVEIGVFGDDHGIHTFYKFDSISLPLYSNLYFVIEVDDKRDINAEMYEMFYIRITQEIANTEALTIEGFPVYESFERVLQHCLDYQFPFYSEYLGREDVVFNLNGDKYLSENQLRFFSLMSGLNLRGALLGEINNPLSLSFDLLFESFSRMLNLGYTIETIDSFERVRVEDYPWFFDETVVLDLSARCSIYDIETEAMPELSFQRIKTGFENFTYEVKNGRGEYNTTQNRTTIINTDSEFDNVSKIRGDMTEMIKLIKNSIFINGSEDMESDNHVFALKTQKDTDWKPETNENITENDSMYGDSSFNLYISPLRNLIRNAQKIKAALTKFPTSYVKFQTSDKSQTLRTTGEGFTITENEDILIDEAGSGLIADPIWKPIKHRVSVRFDYDDLTTLQSNLFGLIKFSDTIQGYLLNLKKKNDEDMAIIEIIEQYAE